MATKLRSLLIGTLTLLLTPLVFSSYGSETVVLVPSGQVSCDWRAVGAPRRFEWQCIDSYPDPEVDDYLYSYSSTSNAIFTFKPYELPVPDNAAINSVTLCYLARQLSPGHDFFIPLIRIGRVNCVIGVDWPHLTDDGWQLRSCTFTTNLGGSPWTVEEVKSLQAGMRALNAKGWGAKITQVYVVVDYN